MGFKGFPLGCYSVSAATKLQTNFILAKLHQSQVWPLSKRQLQSQYHFPIIALRNNQLKGLLVERLIAIQGSNRAFCDTSMKFGTQVEQAEANILRNRAIADLAHGYHGNHVKVLFFTKTHIT